MAKSSSPSTPTPGSTGSAAPSHEVWLAGLGALAQAQAQGTKAFEALVNDGLAFQRKSQEQAQQRLQEATDRLTHLAQDFGQQASVRIDKLEHVFEERVARALHRLGMPTLQDIADLQARVADLEARLAASPPSPAQTAPKAKAPARKAPRKA